MEVDPLRASVAGTSVAGTGTGTGTGTSVADIRSKYIVILIDIITIYNIQFLRDRNSFPRVSFNLLFNRFNVNFNAFKQTNITFKVILLSKYI